MVTPTHEPDPPGAEPDDAPEATPAREPEQVQRALMRVQSMLARQHRVESLVHREQATHEERHALVEGLVRRQHVNELKPIVEPLHPADIAYILEALPPEDRKVVWDSVPSSRDGAVLLEASEAVRDTLIAAMDRDELVAAAEALDADEIAALADSLPPEVVEAVKQKLSAEERAQLRAAMSYPETAVGSRMDFEMVTIRDDVTLEVVLRYLRRFERLPAHTDQVFVVDRDDHLRGALSLDRLLVSDPDEPVSAVMTPELLTLAPFDDVHDAAQAFERYDLVSAPVVDAHGRLVGRLTVDEVVDVIREESHQEVLAAAGLREDEDLFASLWNSARNRWLWLAVNLVTAFFASRVIGSFESTIERVVALATLMTIVMGIAGNSGNQTMTLMIRSIALGHVNPGNQWRLVLKEAAIALLNGLVWGGVAGLVAWLIYRGEPQGWLIGLTMALAMALNMLVGAMVGVFVPLALQRLGRDPALGASVLLTFTTDSLGVFIFLGLATLFFV